MANKKLLLIDGNSVAFRAFYALYRQLDRFQNPEGLHTNAIYAFKNMLDVILKQENPSHVLVAFDAGKVTFRTKLYSDYKGGRQKTPGELLEQIPYIKEMLKDLGIKSYELVNYEADDIIGTYSKMGEEAGYQVAIVSGDKDLTQLASDSTTVYVTKSGVSELEAFTPEHMKEVNGVTPTEFIDMKALMGDNSDNYPGVTKVGPKTASNLIQKYGSVENIYKHIDEMKKSKLKENLINDKDKAFLAKTLATIDRTSPVEFKLDELKKQETNVVDLRKFYEQMNFRRFLAELNNSNSEIGEVSDKKVDYIVLDEQNLNKLPNVKSEVSFYLGMFGENYHLADFVGFSLKMGDNVYVSNDVSLLTKQPLQTLLEDQAVNKNVFDLKRTIVGLHRLGIKANNINYDMLLASYLVNNENNSNDLGEICQLYNYYDLQPDVDIYGKGKKAAIPDEEIFFNHLAGKVLAIEALKPTLLKRLTEHEQDDLYETIEMPVANVLAKMEITGLKTDASTLVQLGNDFGQRLTELEADIYLEAGERFNINSPKQLGQILFEKLELPPIKKTKTGYSTSVEVLEQLKDQSPIVQKVLDYRQIAKIQSTYVKGLLDVIQPDGRVHTRYQQTLTATGRLSSVDPNLQNIPVRLEEGKKIRKAFIPSNKDGYIFSCDYSQVELRVLAHVSGDENMQEAFKTGYDIHAHTAMKIFHLDSPDEVTPNMRRHAKAVNFGIVYGISDYGLSKNLGISRKQAKEFIDNYFEQYPKIKDYMDKEINFAREKGYVETIMHRRRYLPDIHAKNFNVRSFAERTAINSPIQGGAADIIKIAMINMQKKLDELNLKSKMLIQVHDELIFDVPADELETIKKVVPEVMQNAVHLDVPLVADSNWGHDWYEAK
ncbi:DNA polymerase I [Lactobacillus jensenii]|jgi:DNA-directed DNA polymerase|uniref:DNA polymerase I n=3 Tax=Lactobacillus jensenii TaxID=109790 RepID=A0A5N1IES8_LACJE|nr:DNA polymerase I [Lactobacillus jensenii]APT15071.1 DNA polymerase I [Lactobacillus jensenii]EEX26751.1 DNA-directed DNA polymerase [Lactobacillus jensenii SJ-7A-US]KAA9235989.1 DNA polymerase I [Lactobacillus jensenii]KAA9258623.1 DNA polymerase I [Lactobacillus jensenii]KAA9266234.1 DNA polymerase I [Lactobacillus jensenii]